MSIQWFSRSYDQRRKENLKNSSVALNVVLELGDARLPISVVTLFSEVTG
jgi:hypothetical protein